MQTLPIGTRVFNRGDMANAEHWGTITAIVRGNYQITPDADEGLEPYTVFLSMICTVDKGHGGTRIVTEQAYNELRQQQMTAFQRSCGLDRGTPC